MTHNAHAPYLFSTSHGRVLRCSCCGRVQVEFVDLALPMDRPYFERLERRMAEAALDALGNDWFRLRLHTDAGPVDAPLRGREVKHFHRLLGGARAMLRLRDQLCATAEGYHLNTTIPHTPSA